MRKSKSNNYISDDLQLQRDYVKRLKAQGFKFPLIAAESFVRGMRDSGYRSTATAINELIDNAIQAQATRVDVLLAYEPTNKSFKKQDFIAVIDNGHGMDEDMMKAAVMWGGTHGENDRHGLGRYGFGLPSASVSIARRYAVYSKVPGGKWFKITIDLHAIATGKFEGGVVTVPDPVEAMLPDFVRAVLPEGDLAHGTVIVLELLDRLTGGYHTSASFKQNELHQLGVTYRDLLRNTEIHVIDVAATVDDTRVEPIDPLFLRSDARYYDENEVHAEAIPEAFFEVKSEDGKSTGAVRIRYAYMPPGFLPEGNRSSARLKVRKENNGLIIMRAGRQIDVVTRGPRFTVQNNDKYWGAEITFDPTIDEEFGVTTNKQQITISERMWELLRANGLIQAINQMQKRHDKDWGYADTRKLPKDKPSEEIAAEAAKFLNRKATKPSVEKERQSKEALEREAARRAKEKGTTPEKAKEELEAEVAEKPYVVIFEADRGEFYRVERVGGQRRLCINTNHRFYTDVYNHPATTARMKTALELMLFVLGLCELDSEEDREIFYRMERGEWTRRLETYLQLLDRRESVTDDKAAATAQAEDAAEELAS
jgi:hypothetical protein